MKLSVYSTEIAIIWQVVQVFIQHFGHPRVVVEKVRTGYRVFIVDVTDEMLTYLRTHVPSVETVTEV